MTFYGEYHSLRSKLDYTFHQTYSKKRQLFQDKLLNQHFKFFECTPQKEAKLIYTAGCMGAGKTHSIKKLAVDLSIDLDNTIIIDPDKFKEMIPEYQDMKKKSPEQAGTHFHLESAILSELALEIALNNSYHIICDGSMVDHQWFGKEINRIRQQYPSYIGRMVIIYVQADWNKIIKRVESRCTITKRCVDQKKLNFIYHQIPKSIENLKNKVDQVIYINNNDQPRIESRHISVRPSSAFQSNNNSARDESA